MKDYFLVLNEDALYITISTLVIMLITKNLLDKLDDPKTLLTKDVDFFIVSLIFYINSSMTFSVKYV